MKPTSRPQPSRWRGVKHCQLNAMRHGAYSAEVFSARAFLRMFDALLSRLETAAFTNVGEHRGTVYPRLDH